MHSKMKIINSVLQWIVQIIQLRNPATSTLKRRKKGESIGQFHTIQARKKSAFNNTFKQYQENFSVFGKHEHKASIAGNMREIPEY